jgi:hypothetical protein
MTVDTPKEEPIHIPPILLEWSDWTPWSDLAIDARALGSGVRVPNNTPGVYEARHGDSGDCLTIGKASNLRHRIKQGLVKGMSPHSAGKKIRANEDLTRILVRWAVTDRPAATEEELHRRHVASFGKLPKYVDHT